MCRNSGFFAKITLTGDDKGFFNPQRGANNRNGAQQNQAVITVLQTNTQQNQPPMQPSRFLLDH